jgi:hypothetical protein
MSSPEPAILADAGAAAISTASEPSLGLRG